jgi:hypothetical protein
MAAFGDSERIGAGSRCCEWFTRSAFGVLEQLGDASGYCVAGAMAAVGDSERIGEGSRFCEGLTRSAVGLLEQLGDGSGYCEGFVREVLGEYKMLCDSGGCRERWGVRSSSISTEIGRNHRPWRCDAREEATGRIEIN